MAPIQSRIIDLTTGEVVGGAIASAASAQYEEHVANPNCPCNCRTCICDMAFYGCARVHKVDGEWLPMMSDDGRVICRPAASVVRLFHGAMKGDWEAFFNFIISNGNRALTKNFTKNPNFDFGGAKKKRNRDDDGDEVIAQPAKRPATTPATSMMPRTQEGGAASSSGATTKEAHIDISGEDEEKSDDEEDDM